MNYSLDESLHLRVPKPLPWKIRRSVVQRSVPKVGVSSTPVPLKKLIDDDVHKEFAKYQQEDGEVATISSPSITASSKKVETLRGDNSKGQSIISEHYINKVIHSFRTKSNSTKCTVGKESQENKSNSSNCESNNNIECDDLFKNFLKDASNEVIDKTSDVNKRHKQEIKVNRKYAIDKSSSNEDNLEFREPQSRKHRDFKGKSNKLHQRKYGNLSSNDDFSSDESKRKHKGYRKRDKKLRYRSKYTRKQQNSDSEDPLTSPKNSRRQPTRSTYKKNQHYSNTLSSSDELDNVAVRNIINSSKAVSKTFGVHKQVTKTDKSVDSCSMKLIVHNNEIKNNYKGRKGVKEYLGPLLKKQEFCEPSNKVQRKNPVLIYDCGIDVQQNKDKRQTLFDDSYDGEIDVVGVDDEHINNENSNLLKMLQEWDSNDEEILTEFTKNTSIVKCQQETGEEENKQIENTPKSLSSKLLPEIKNKGSTSKIITNPRTNINIISNIVLNNLKNNESDEKEMISETRSLQISEKNKIDTVEDLNDEEINTKKSPKRRNKIEDTQKAKKSLDENLQNLSEKEVYIRGKSSQIVTLHSDESNDEEFNKINKKVLVIIKRISEIDGQSEYEEIEQRSSQIVEENNSKNNVKKSTSSKKENTKISKKSLVENVEDSNEKKVEYINNNQSTRKIRSKSTTSQNLEKNKRINEEISIKKSIIPDSEEEKERKSSQINVKNTDKSYKENSGKKNNKISMTRKRKSNIVQNQVERQSDCEEIRTLDENFANEIEDLCKEKIKIKIPTSKKKGKKENTKKTKKNLVDDLNEKEKECINNNQSTRSTRITRSKSAISQNAEEKVNEEIYSKTSVNQVCEHEKSSETGAQHSNESIEGENSKINKKILEIKKGKSDIQNQGEEKSNVKRTNKKKSGFINIETSGVIENVDDLSKKDKNVLNKSNVNFASDKKSVTTQKQTEKELYDIEHELRETHQENKIVQDGKRKSSIAKRLFPLSGSESDLTVSNSKKNTSKISNVDINSIVNNEDTFKHTEKENTPLRKSTRSNKLNNCETLQNNKCDDLHKESLSSVLKENSTSKSNKLKIQTNKDSKFQSTLQTVSKKDNITPGVSLLPSEVYLSSIDVESVCVSNDNQKTTPYVSIEKSSDIENLIQSQQASSEFNFTKPKVLPKRSTRSKKQKESNIENSENTTGENNSTLRRSGRQRTQTKFPLCYYMMDSKSIRGFADKSINIIIPKNVKEAENFMRGNRRNKSELSNLENDKPSSSGVLRAPEQPGPSGSKTNREKKTSKSSNKKSVLSNLKVIEEEILPIPEIIVDTNKSSGKMRKKNNQENNNVLQENSSCKKNEKRKLSCDEITKDDHIVENDDFNNVEALEYFKRGQEYIALQESGVYETLPLSYDSSTAGRLKICGSKKSKRTLDNCYMHLVVLRGRCKIQINDNDQRILEKDDYALIPVGSTYSIANDDPNEMLELYYCQYQTREANLLTVV